MEGLAGLFFPIKNFLKPPRPEASESGSGLYLTSPRTAENGSSDLSKGEVNPPGRQAGPRHPEYSG